MYDASRTYYQPMRQSHIHKAPQELAAPSVSPFPANLSVAMAYVPMQEDTNVYSEMQALEQGTLFPTLNKPFWGSGNR